MSAITATWRSTTTHTARTARATEPQTCDDHGLLVKVTAGVLLVAAAAATIAPLGWAALAVAVIILLATTAAVLHTTLQMLNEADR